MTKEKMLSLYGFLCSVEPFLIDHKIPDFLLENLLSFREEIENEILLLMRESAPGVNSANQK
jgi:hypothetical protein